MSMHFSLMEVFEHCLVHRKNFCFILFIVHASHILLLLFIIIFLYLFSSFILFYFLTLQYCIGFAIYQHDSATGIHMFPILNPPPSSLPIPSLWVVPVHQPQASSIMHRTWTGDSFHIWYCTCFNAILPNHPTLSLSHRVQKTVLYISVSFAVSYTGLLLPYICVSILYWCFSFWLTSPCIIGSSFIHLIRTDSNVFFLMAE